MKHSLTLFVAAVLLTLSVAACAGLKIENPDYTQGLNRNPSVPGAVR